MNSKKQNANKAKAEEISRKEALKKMGRYAGMTALGTFMILNPKKAQAASPIDPGGFGF
jgi:hypothetical protein|tara:strand:+ start:355 stop:531 length:177 start_codon:yes stop_codon:yes gene_type:complete